MEFWPDLQPRQEIKIKANLARLREKACFCHGNRHVYKRGP